MDKMHSCQQETPKLCSRCREFYGSPQNLGLCSKCHKDFLREKIAKSAAAVCLNETTACPAPSHHTLVHATSSLSVNEETNPPLALKKRCKSCNKKVGLIGFWCRCGGTFCGTHRYPEEHACQIDYKTAAEAVLIKENPLCKGDKLSNRV